MDLPTDDATSAIDSPVTRQFLAQRESFNRQARELGYKDLSTYVWYHVVDLGHGLVTPGMFDFRHSVHRLPIPDTMNGLSVLDIGSATGYFSFEFERRGATVVSVELPSLDYLDRFPGQTVEDLIPKLATMVDPQYSSTFPSSNHTYSPQELYEFLLDGPFLFCREVLQSRVQRCYSSVYDLTPEKTRIPSFDLVFLGDVLLHTLYPLRALAAAAALCHGTLILAQIMGEGAEPSMTYVGGDDPLSDDIQWWLPNRPCFEQVLRKLGFRDVAAAENLDNVELVYGTPVSRTVLVARRQV